MVYWKYEDDGFPESQDYETNYSTEETETLSVEWKMVYRDGILGSFVSWGTAACRLFSL